MSTRTTILIAIAAGLALVLLLAFTDGPMPIAEATHESEEHCNTDPDASHFVDITDVSAFTARFGTAQGSTYDIAPPPSGNGFTDITDVAMVTADFGLECYGYSELSPIVNSATGLLAMCEFEANHRIHSKTPNNVPPDYTWGFAYVTWSFWTRCLTENGLNYETWCADGLQIQYQTVPPGPWFGVGGTDGDTDFGDGCDSHTLGGFFVMRGQMLRDDLGHSLNYTPTNTVVHGPETHGQYYHWLIP